jgi:hypothetical protein
VPDEPRPEKSVLDDWTDTLARELGVEVAVDITTLLEVARDAAHNVLRPAAPITTFLVGYAAAQRGGSATDIADASAAASALALAWDAAAHDPE